MIDLIELLQPEHSIATHPDLPNVKAFFMPIGPALAEKLLAGYKMDYRKYLKTHAESIAVDMENDNFLFNGDTLCIMADGSLGDGQHRLDGVKRSGKTFVFLIVTGLTLESYDVMGTAAVRKYANALVRKGYTKNAALLAWLIQIIYRWEHSLPIVSAGKISHLELDKSFAKHESEILRSVELTVGGSKKIKMSPALVAFCWWMFRQIDVEKASTFMTQVTYGEYIGGRDPAYVLRLKLEDGKIEKYNRHQILCLCFKAFNAFEAGIPIAGITKGDGTRASVDKVNPVVIYAERMKALKKREEMLESGNSDQA